MREWWDQEAERRRTGTSQRRTHAALREGRCARSREKRGTNVRRRHRRRWAIAQNADLDNVCADLEAPPPLERESEGQKEDWCYLWVAFQCELVVAASWDGGGRVERGAS
ncbi:hypothetical protein B0H13DRAFT_1872112 [Mycena leptocephala]|nr:hypothetical protein B0H13DRAFT_1872112 [Mycena leptocephala]